MRTEKDIDELIVDDAINEALIRGLRAEVERLRAKDVERAKELHFANLEIERLQAEVSALHNQDWDALIDLRRRSRALGEGK